jgi:hypothetical protein
MSNTTRWSGKAWLEKVTAAFHVCDSCSRSIKRGDRMRLRIVVLGRYRGRPQGVLRIEHPECPQAPEKDAADKAWYQRNLGRAAAKRQQVEA